MIGWEMNKELEKDLEESSRDLMEVVSRLSSWGNKEHYKEHVRMAGVLAEIRTEDLLNTRITSRPTCSVLKASS
jgi:hypothetical protein